MNISSISRVCVTIMMFMTLLGACASAPKVRVDQDSHVNFADYKTFAWLPAKPMADSKTPINTLAEQRVRAALTSVLQGKGYQLDEARPDVRVQHEFEVHDRPKQSGMRIGIGAGGGSGNVGGGVGVSLPVGKRTETVAVMTVSVSDVARNEQVWFGSSEVILSGSDASDAEVKALIDKILAKYPARVQ